MNAGIEIAIITGRKSQIVENRMTALGIKLIYQGQDDKVKAYQDICDKLSVNPENTGYIGDDLIDWACNGKSWLEGLCGRWSPATCKACKLRDNH